MNHDTPWPRRSVLKALGATTLTAGCTATAIGRPPGSPTVGATPLEATASTVDYVVYVGLDGEYTAGAAAPDTDVADPREDFGFPAFPAATGTDPAGTMFDTTAAKISSDGASIQYFLQYGDRRTPYQLDHGGGGTYRSRDATVDFEWAESEWFALPFFSVGASYRAIARDVVQLYEPGGAFDWSATRTDFFGRPSGAHVASLVTVVWDEDGPDNGEVHERGSPGLPVGHPDGPRPPVFPTGVTPTVGGLTIGETVASLVQAGIWSDEAG